MAQTRSTNWLVTQEDCKLFRVEKQKKQTYLQIPAGQRVEWTHSLQGRRPTVVSSQLQTHCTGCLKGELHVMCPTPDGHCQHRQAGCITAETQHAIVTSALQQHPKAEQASRQVKPGALQHLKMAISQPPFQTAQSCLKGELHVMCPAPCVITGDGSAKQRRHSVRSKHQRCNSTRRQSRPAGKRNHKRCNSTCTWPFHNLRRTAKSYLKGASCVMCPTPDGCLSSQAVGVHHDGDTACDRNLSAATAPEGRGGQQASATMSAATALGDGQFTTSDALQRLFERRAPCDVPNSC